MGEKIQINNYLYNRVASFTFGFKPSTMYSSPTNGHILNAYTHVHLLNPLQDGDTLLHRAAREGRTTYVAQHLSTPGIGVKTQERVSWPIEY